jgi:hypothetical protein
VRVENADTSTYKVEVQVWEKGVDASPDNAAKGLPVEGIPDRMVQQETLGHPTAMGTYGIHSGRYLRVVELPA